MWVLPVGIFAIVTLIVGVAILSTMKDGQSFRDIAFMSFGSFLGVYIFSTSFLAFMLTAVSSPTMQDWWTTLTIRVAWQIGGGVLLAIATLFDAWHDEGYLDPAVWIMLVWSVVFVMIGGWCALNPLRDLVEGPVAFQAVGLNRHEWYNFGKGGGPEVNGTLSVRAADGSSREINLIGWQENRAEDLLQNCAGSTRLTAHMLVHMDEVLDVSCEP